MDYKRRRILATPFRCDAHSILINVSSFIAGSQHDQGPVCGGVCCDAETERQLQAKATKNFERLVKHHIRSQRGHWETAANLYKEFTYGYDWTGLTGHLRAKRQNHPLRALYMPFTTV
uniref:Uncharacterized protein n=1 Tax=Anopheles culicifacies TaxID=139723 RepID=A0A182M8P6_9DIPT